MGNIIPFGSVFCPCALDIESNDHIAVISTNWGKAGLRAVLDLEHRNIMSHKKVISDPGFEPGSTLGKIVKKVRSKKECGKPAEKSVG